MAITGTMAAGDQISGQNLDIAVDQVGDGAAFANIESWGNPNQHFRRRHANVKLQHV